MVKDRSDNIWWTQKERPKSIIPFNHLAELNQRREAQAMKAAKARQAKNSYLDLEPGITVSNHVFFLFKYQILILMWNKAALYGTRYGQRLHAWLLQITFLESMHKLTLRKS